MKNRFFILSVVMFGFGSPAFADGTFAGRWETTFGPMVLTQEGAVVSGTYFFQAQRCTLQGKVDKTKLIFTYREPAITGEGEFVMSTDGRSFAGKWREKGKTQWESWTGKRVIHGFEGCWSTSFGQMRLLRSGTRVEGVYSGGASLAGNLKGNRFEFRYVEPTTKGQGWFELSSDGSGFQGKWKQDGSAGWKDWVGKRLEPIPGRIWLVVLEVPWERGLAESEYSFGRMLKAFFARAPSVQVRHKIFNSEAGLRKWCGELAFLPEPVVLVIASHGSPRGIDVGGKAIGAQPFAESLRYADNVKLLHFSACLTMKGTLAKDIGDGLGKGRNLPISGYTTSVDWAASAIIEFMYLDLILVRGMAPAAAAKQLEKLLPFSGDKTKNGAPFPAAGFRFLGPR